MGAVFVQWSIIQVYFLRGCLLHCLLMTFICGGIVITPSWKFIKTAFGFSCTHSHTVLLPHSFSQTITSTRTYAWSRQHRNLSVYFHKSLVDVDGWPSDWRHLCTSKHTLQELCTYTKMCLCSTGEYLTLYLNCSYHKKLARICECVVGVHL